MVCAVLFNSVDESGLSSMTMVSFELLLIVFKHEGLRSALDQVKQTASDTRKTRYVRTVWLYFHKYITIILKYALHLIDVCCL